ncbi:mCG1036967, partial [Mus musculus]
YRSDRYRSHRSRIHILKSLHAPRKSLKLPRSKTKSIESYTLGPASLRSWREPTSQMSKERHQFALTYKVIGSKCRQSFPGFCKEEATQGRMKPLDPRAWPLGLRS